MKTSPARPGFVLADSGPLYAAVDRDDQFHRRARRELRQLSVERIPVVVQFPILCESYTLVLYRLGVAPAHRFSREIEAGADLVNPGPEAYSQALARLRSFPDQAITLFDALLAVLSERLLAPVWTYDHHFRILGCDVWAGEGSS